MLKVNRGKVHVSLLRLILCNANWYKFTSLMKYGKLL